ncbi:MAG TPA: glycosyltransferase family 4 protein [Gemmatimonadaceae bacterium]|nr:glycosyltransferase family 4 protein [Gemmatimonadaceae bacterium]
MKVIFALTDMLVATGHDVDLFSYANAPEWYSQQARLVEAKDLSSVDMRRYDFVVVSNAVFIPMVLPVLGGARCVFLAQDYESFHHATDTTYESFLAESPAFKALYSLPVPIISISRPIARLIKERIGKTAYYLPVGLNKSVFRPQAHAVSGDRKRVLLVGNYLMPYKGMRDGLDALEKLSADIPVELVLITQEERGRNLFDSYSFPKEVHFCPAETDVPRIIASCDAYCCTSWYEGLGLPALEAFCVGTPVVSTRTLGVDDYAEDGNNLLLANPSDPDDLRDKLQRLLTDANLAERLVQGGFKTMKGRYEWDISLAAFMSAITDIDATYTGAGELDTPLLEDLLEELEREGSLTPIATYREFHRLDRELSRAADELANGVAVNGQIHDLAVIRDDLKRYVSNSRTQYYAAFKAKYDFCLLLIELAGSPDRVYIQRLVHPQRGANAGTNATALTEVRYTQP